MLPVQNMKFGRAGFRRDVTLPCETFTWWQSFLWGFCSRRWYLPGEGSVSVDQPNGKTKLQQVLNSKLAQKGKNLPPNAWSACHAVSVCYQQTVLIHEDMTKFPLFKESKLLWSLSHLYPLHCPPLFPGWFFSFP